MKKHTKRPVSAARLTEAALSITKGGGGLLVPTRESIDWTRTNYGGDGALFADTRDCD